MGDALDLGTGVSPETVDQVIRDHASLRGDQLALTDGTRTLTYADLDRVVDERARELGAVVGAGDRVALWLANSVEWVVLTLAVQRLRAITIPINTRYRSHELENALRTTATTCLVYEENALTNHLGAHVAEVCLDGDGAVDATLLPQLRTVLRADLPLADQLSPVDIRTREEPRPSDLLSVFFTSGSSGTPRAAAHSQASFVAHARNVARRQRVGPEDCILLPLPLTGVYGYGVFVEALVSGCPMVITGTWDASWLSELIDRYTCTVLAITDAYIGPMMALEESPWGSVRVVVSAIEELEALAVVRAFDKFGVSFSQSYGMSEVQALIYLNEVDADERERAIAGGAVVTAGTRARTIDRETGEVLPDGAEGELQISGPVVMAGYLGWDPEQEQVTLRDAVDADGWFSTGDLGRTWTDPPRLEYLGRIGDAVRLSGFLVHPQEVETFVAEHVPVTAVCKASFAQIDGRLRCIVYVESTEEIDTAQVLARCQAGLANFKVPHAICRVDHIDRIDGAQGKKVDRRRLKVRTEELVEQGLLPEAGVPELSLVAPDRTIETRRNQQ